MGVEEAEAGVQGDAFGLRDGTGVDGDGSEGYGFEAAGEKGCCCCCSWTTGERD